MACVVPAAHGANRENPFSFAKVGDWAEYKMTAQNIDGTTKMTIVSKDEKEVTYQIESSFSFMGNKTVEPVRTMKIDLTLPYDAISAANLKSNNVKIENLAEGKEKLNVADKEYDTTWTKLRATADTNGVRIVSEYQMWFCKSVPLGGLVRMDTNSGTFSSRLELVGSGSK
jgi:hypothetical protein